MMYKMVQIQSRLIKVKKLLMRRTIVFSQKKNFLVEEEELEYATENNDYEYDRIDEVSSSIENLKD